MMRKFMIALAAGAALAALSPSGSSAQRTETLVDGRLESSGYGGPAVRFTQMYDQFAVMVGGQGGWVINRTFTLGGAGYGMVTQPTTNVVDERDRPVELQFGYGGVVLEYMYQSWKVVHWSVQTLIGAGGAIYQDSRGNDIDEDGVFVAEPEFNIALNFTRSLRISAGIGYRFVADVDLVGAEDSDFSGLSGVLLLKFGGF